MDSAKRTCSIEGCEKAMKTRGWCRAHYARWQRHGDPLAGRNRMKVSGACSIEGCDQAMKTRGWCTLHYARWLKTGSTALQALTLAQRFWPKVVVMGEDECWEWMGQRGAGGYGYLYAGDGAGASPRRAHRVAYELTVGPIPSGLLVCHRCDNPPCCNPAHLFLGTSADNSADMVAKGRQNRGEKHGRAKLTAKDVAQIRASAELHRVLAQRYGVDRSTIWRARTGRRWC